jgi:hypothetical protein
VRKLLVFGASVALLSSFAPNAAEAKTASTPSGKADADASILINAPPRTVWKAIHIERNQNPEVEYSKIVQDGGNVKTLEQKFTNIPFLGSVVAVTRQIEETNKHIDYSLVRSDKFKALDGAWDLTPVNGGKQTMLQLQTHVDIGIPFSSVFIHGTAQKKLTRRLASVKTIAEKEQARIAANGGE